MAVAVSIGGLTQIVPLFFQDVTNTPVEGMKPYTALQLEGRDIYIREGCVGCHSQMIRPFRAETERYGHYSVAGERLGPPLPVGSKRTGPDLARVGSRYSDDWHRAHLFNPRNVVPESKMPAYPWLVENKLDGKDIEKKLEVMRTLGVPPTLLRRLAPRRLFNPRNVVPGVEDAGLPVAGGEQARRQATSKKLSDAHPRRPIPTKTSRAPGLAERQDRNGRRGRLPAGARHLDRTNGDGNGYRDAARTRHAADHGRLHRSGDLGLQRQRKKSFDEATMLPFADDPEAKSTSSKLQE